MQVEGAWDEDGKAPSIWDTAPEKRIKNGDSCHTAYDHYHRYKEDVALMKKIGLKSYRFSISWPRIMPEKGKVNPEGIAFYKNLIAELPEGLEEARRNSFETQVGEGSNSLYMDPIALGKASSMMKKVLSADDLQIISQPIDFVGLNVYQPSNGMIDKKRKSESDTDVPKTMMGWVIDGRCLYWTIRQYYERYHLPIMVTENGMANPDEVGSDGCVHDALRCDFLDSFISELKRAVDEGIPVLGYQHWSIMDNFEWCEGYEPRFGLIHIDYLTQKRTIKDSIMRKLFVLMAVRYSILMISEERYGRKCLN